MLYEFEDEDAKLEGLFVAALYDSETRFRIAEYLKQHGVPNPIPSAGLHTTIVYSRVPVDFPENHTVDVTVDTSNAIIELWPNARKQNVLVLRIVSPYLTMRFQEAMKAGATYDFPEYNPHITLSYDVGDWDHSNLPTPNFPLKIVGEYTEPLEFDFPVTPLDERKWKDINSKN